MRRHGRGANCCVVGCDNYQLDQPELEFYTFPIAHYKREQREKWIAAVKRINPDGTPWQPNKNTRICSAHFIGHSKSEHPLSPSFVPTIFPTKYHVKNPSKKATANLNARHQRNLQKSTKVTKPSESEEMLHQETSPTEITENVQEDPVEHSTPLFKDEGVQVNFLPINNLNCNIFICNLTNTGKRGTAETQASFNCDIDTKSKKSERVENFSNNMYANKCVGPDPIDLNDNSLLKCQKGFHGMESIHDDQGLRDLAGVDMNTFKFLMQFMLLNRSTEKLTV